MISRVSIAQVSNVIVTLSMAVHYHSLIILVIILVRKLLCFLSLRIEYYFITSHLKSLYDEIGTVVIVILFQELISQKLILSWNKDYLEDTMTGKSSFILITFF